MESTLQIDQLKRLSISLMIITQIKNHSQSTFLSIMFTLHFKHLRNQLINIKQSHNPLVEKNLDPKSKYGQVQKKETFGSSKNTQLMQQWFKKWMKLSERFSPSLRNQVLRKRPLYVSPQIMEGFQHQKVHPLQIFP